MARHEISVVIPTRDRLDWLKACIASVMRQSVTAEIIVVDDGSGDGTREYLDGCGVPLRVVRTPRLGPGPARNAGIAAAHARYVAFLDSDDMWYPHTLAAVSRAIEGFPSAAIICGRSVEFDHEREPETAHGEAIVPSMRLASSFLAALPLRFFPYPSATTIRRDLLVEIGGYAKDGLNAEDVDLYLRAGDAPVAVIDSPALTMRRIHNRQLTHDLDGATLGIARLITTECAGGYAGGRAHVPARRRLIGACARYYVPRLLRARQWRSAIDLAWPASKWGLRYEPYVLPGWIGECLAAVGRRPAS